MKHIYSFFVLIFLIAAAACGSRKATLASELHTSQTASAEASKAAVIDSAAHSHLTETEQKNVEVEDSGQKIRIEFDTDKPINSDTKLPPVQSVEITVKRQKTSDKSAKTAEQSNVVNYDRATLDALNSRRTIATDEKITEETSRKESQFLKWTAIISLAAAAIFIAITIKKSTQGTGIISKVLSWIKGIFKI